MANRKLTPESRALKEQRLADAAAGRHSPRRIYLDERKAREWLAALDRAERSVARCTWRLSKRGLSRRLFRERGE